MEIAIEEAKKAELMNEVPVGAVTLDKGGEIIARAHNMCISLNDPTAHAEVLAIRKAGEYISNYRITDCIVVSTVEPCIMCMGCLVNARIAGLVFGCRDPKAGAVYSKIDFFNEIKWINHRFWVLEGIRSKECGRILKDFFKKKRK